MLMIVCGTAEIKKKPHYAGLACIVLSLYVELLSSPTVVPKRNSEDLY